MVGRLLAQRGALACEEQSEAGVGRLEEHRGYIVLIIALPLVHGGFYLFYISWARSVRGWRLIARQHMVPFASDHSNTSLSNCASPCPQSPPAAENTI